MIRICPTCKKTLTSRDFFFCNFCGATLTSSVISSERNFLRYIDLDLGDAAVVSLKDSLHIVSLKLKHILTYKTLLILAFAVFVISIPTLILNSRRGLELNKNVAFNTEDSKKAGVIDLGLSLRAHVFGSDKITDYIPHDVIFYGEAHEFNLLAKQFVEYDNYYKEFFDKLGLYVGNHFAVFVTKSEENYNVSMVLVLRDPELTLEELDVPRYEWLNFAKFNDVLLITTDAKLSAEVTSVVAGHSKGIKQNSVYAVARSSLPKSGKILLVTPLTDGKNYLTELGKLPISKDFKAVIDAYTKAEHEYAVIM